MQRRGYSDPDHTLGSRILRKPKEQRPLSADIWAGRCRDHASRSFLPISQPPHRPITATAFVAVIGTPDPFMSSAQPCRLGVASDDIVHPG
jgi:hypothetical protein